MLAPLVRYRCERTIARQNIYEQKSAQEPPQIYKGDSRWFNKALNARYSNTVNRDVNFVMHTRACMTMREGGIACPTSFTAR